MNYVPVILVLAALTNQSQPTDYKTAYKRSMEGDKPLLVLVTAEWCPPCQRMKKSTIPALIDNDKFRHFNFATVDLDKDRTDARKLIGNGSIPQLIVYEKIAGEWKVRSLKGYKTADSVESFLRSSSPVRTAEATRLAVGQ